MLPWTASVSRTAAKRAKAAGDWGLAVKHYGRALQRDPRSAPTWVQYGNALRECGKALEAETAYRRSLELADTDPDAHVQLGHLLKLQRRGNEAILEYLRALELDPWLLHASQELIELGWTSHVKPPGSRHWRHSVGGNLPEPALRSTSRLGSPLVIDASDLLLHFLHARLPTGIQRVQLQIIAGVLDGQDRHHELVLACFAPFRDYWVSVPEGLFVTLAGLAASDGATDERPWQEAVLELTSVLVHGEPIEFAAGAVLVNLGASWPHLNYFLRIRNAKARHGIRFIPFVHDCVPVLMPELCVEATVRSYIDWLLGVFFHADGFLVNSNSTAVDLSNLAAGLGHRISPPQIIRLDGQFSAAGQPGGASGPKFGRLARWSSPAEPFVLLVSTFEPRKNHLLAFRAWQQLIEKRGMRHTPPLVCVGHRGWKSETAMSLLRSNKTLQRRVRILTGIADADLAELYQRCLFTFYPSVYEGWGLPVTESLCHGKVPLITAVSSLPEAGGDFAEYFDLNSPEELVLKLERLIDDHNYRAHREAFIRTEFRPRRWGSIAGQLVDYAVTRQNGGFDGHDEWAPLAEIGQYQAFARGRETGIRAGMIAGEMFRIGEGWWVPEEWGCWLKGTYADLVFSLPELGGRPCFLYLGVRGLPMQCTDFQVTIQETDGVCRSGRLEPDQNQWPMLRIEPNASRGMVRLRIASNQTCNLAEISGGLDHRMVTLGVIGFYVDTNESSGTVPDFVRNAGTA
jgi:glycosyltransferase involved in cell wall biosynthesis